MLGQIPGKRRGHFQRGHKKGSGLLSETEAVQEEEEMCTSVKSEGTEAAGLLWYCTHPEWLDDDEEEEEEQQQTVGPL